MPNTPPESQVLRDSLTREVTNDAYAISGQIFKGQEPDVSRVSNDQVDARYRQAFESNDRQYLMAEAARDPAQFLASMERLGVTLPADKPLEQQAPLPQAAKPNVPLPSFPDHATQSYDNPQDIPPPTAAGLTAPPPSSPPPTVPAAPPPPTITPGSVPTTTAPLPPGP